MQEKADHPHQAAVHLMKALKCCSQCSDTQQLDIIEVRQLQYRKNILAEQLKQITIRGESVELLESEIRQLDDLIVRLQDQNNRMEQEGLRHVEMAVEERKAFQQQQLATIMTELQIEIEENKVLKMEMQGLLQRVKYLNRVNNQLVYKFTNL